MKESGKGIIIGALLAALFLVVVLGLQAEKPEPRTLGIIQDFEVSAGGYAHSDLCKVVINNSSIALSGNICSKLKSGHMLVVTEHGFYRVLE